MRSPKACRSPKSSCGSVSAKCRNSVGEAKTGRIGLAKPRETVLLRPGHAGGHVVGFSAPQRRRNTPKRRRSPALGDNRFSGRDLFPEKPLPPGAPKNQLYRPRPYGSLRRHMRVKRCGASHAFLRHGARDMWATSSRWYMCSAQLLCP